MGCVSIHGYALARRDSGHELGALDADDACVFLFDVLHLKMLVVGWSWCAGTCGVRACKLETV